MKLRCGITMGDPSGIGPEIILKALNGRALRGLAEFIVIGDRGVLNRYPGYNLSERRDVSFLDLNNVPKKGFAFGRVRAEYGRAAREYLDKALELIKARQIDCLVTAPINKEAVNLSGCAFSGHTEYIAGFFGIKDFEMMLFNPKMRVSLVSRHIPLKEVSKGLSRERIYRAILNSAQGLRSFFRIRKPRIAVCGLNPHASDNGSIGDEEERLIKPAIKKARVKGVWVKGPFPADTLFAKADRQGFDCVLAMYHDQGLIPLKLTGVHQVVNITLGLPFARTSCGHGTAMDIAGKDVADPASFILAVKSALQCSRDLRKD